MKVQEDLVWDKYSNELIGYVDLGDTDLNYATLNKVDKLATHVLAFLVKSIVNLLSYSLATFSTDNNKAHQLFPLFWRAVANLELICNLKVIAAASDGASPNRKFFLVILALGELQGICGIVDCMFYGVIFLKCIMRTQNVDSNTSQS